EDTVVTLAHEFQHMIHYYQRDIVLGASTETWLNEMMSLVSEDLVGRKLFDGIQGLNIRGPRGVLPSLGGGAGPADNDYGRLPLYNANPSINLTTWLSLDDVLKSYSIAYAFGAFLTRNFGGAELLQAMMDSASSNSETVISSAIAAAGGPAGATMDDLLWKWGVSVLLSDDPLAPSGFRMNTGGWIDSTVDTTTYSLGSINHFNYNPAGPVIHTASSYPLAEMEGMSTIFYELGLGQTGALTATLLVPNGVDFTVVVK
ncbi:MAG: peptidase M30, partial [Spirochaetaceae bacterium]|nr:peptidase M30 [Spirochaetaceae bacterium]